MSTDIAALSFRIDSSGLKASNEEMQRLIENSRRLQQENDRLEQRVTSLQDRYKRYADDLKKTNDLAKQQADLSGGLGAKLGNATMSLIDAPFKAAGYAGVGVGYAAGASADLLASAIERRLGFKFADLNPVNIFNRVQQRAVAGFSSYGDYDRLRTPDMKQFIGEMRLFSEAMGTSLPNLRHWYQAVKESGVTMERSAVLMDRFRRLSISDPNLAEASGVIDALSGSRFGPRASPEDMMFSASRMFRNMAPGDARNALISAVFGTADKDIQALVRTARAQSPIERLATETENRAVASVASASRSRAEDDIIRSSAAADRLREAVPAMLRGSQDYIADQIGRGGGFGALGGLAGTLFNRLSFAVQQPFRGPEGMEALARQMMQEDEFFRGMANPKGPGYYGAARESIQGNTGFDIDRIGKFFSSVFGALTSASQPAMDAFVDAAEAFGKAVTIAPTGSRPRYVSGSQGANFTRQLEQLDYIDEQTKRDLFVSFADIVARAPSAGGVSAAGQKRIADFGRDTYGRDYLQPEPDLLYFSQNGAATIQSGLALAQRRFLRSNTDPMRDFGIEAELEALRSIRGAMEGEISKISKFQGSVIAREDPNTSAEAAAKAIAEAMRNLPQFQGISDRITAGEMGLRRRDAQFGYSYGLDLAGQDLGQRQSLMQDQIDRLLKTGDSGNAQMAAMLTLAVTQMRSMVEANMRQLRSQEESSDQAGESARRIAGAGAAAGLGRAPAGAAAGAQAQAIIDSLALQGNQAAREVIARLTEGMDPDAAASITGRYAGALGDLRNARSFRAAGAARDRIDALIPGGLRARPDIAGILSGFVSSVGQGTGSAAASRIMAGAANQGVLLPQQQQLEVLQNYLGLGAIAPENRELAMMLAQSGQLAIRSGAPLGAVQGLGASRIYAQESISRGQRLVDLERQAQGSIASRAAIGVGGAERIQINLDAENQKQAINNRLIGEAEEKQNALAEIEKVRVRTLETLNATQRTQFEVSRQATADELTYQQKSVELLGQAEEVRARELTTYRTRLELSRQFKDNPEVSAQDIEAQAQAAGKAAEGAALVAKQMSYANQYASSFTYRLEDAILRFSDMRSVVGALSQDFARIALREAFLDPLKNGIAGAIRGVGIGSAVQGVVSGGLKWVGSGIGSLFGFSEGGVMSSGGPVRYYGSGGVARTPQLAVFGEGTKPEAYIPMEDGHSVPISRRSIGGRDVYAVELPGGRSIPARLTSFADGGVMTSDGPRSLSRSASSAVVPVGGSGPKIETTVNVNVAGGASDKASGQEIGKQVSNEVNRTLRSMVGDEIRRQMRIGGMLNQGF